MDLQKLDLGGGQIAYRSQASLHVIAAQGFLPTSICIIALPQQHTRAPPLPPIVPRSPHAHHDLRSPEARVRVRCPRAVHRYADDEHSSHEAPPGYVLLPPLLPLCFADFRALTAADLRSSVYVNNINKVIDGPHGAALKGLSLAAIQANVMSFPEEIRTPVINAGGGHYNHCLFFDTFAKVGSCNSAPMGDVKAKIEQDFGSFDEMKTKFNSAAAGVFGSGWAWLSLDSDGKLFISSTPNQENPLMAGRVGKTGTPVLGLDVWEHAY